MNFDKVLDDAGGAAETNITQQIVVQTRRIFDQLRPDNFDQLVKKFVSLPLEDNEERISSVVDVLFEKSINEPSYSSLYAKMVHEICRSCQETSKIFRKKILDQCQKEFLKSSADDEDIKEREIAIEKADDESKKQTLKEEFEEKRTQMRKRRLGNVRFIGELYNLQMLTPRIMIDCATMLLSMDEENLECLCILLTTVGWKLEEQIKEIELANYHRINGGQEVKFAPEPGWFDKTFHMLNYMSKLEALSSRIRCALLDLHELRQNNWKTIEVRRDAISQEQRGGGDFKKQIDCKTVPSSNSYKSVTARGHEAIPQQPASTVHSKELEPLSATVLAAAHPNDQKQMLGERLFPLIHEKFPILAGKITGMLLEMDNAEILRLLEDYEMLNSRIEEAVLILQMHQTRINQN